MGSDLLLNRSSRVDASSSISSLPFQVKNMEPRPRDIHLFAQTDRIIQNCRSSCEKIISYLNKNEQINLRLEWDMQLKQLQHPAISLNLLAGRISYVATFSRLHSVC